MLLPSEACTSINLVTTPMAAPAPDHTVSCYALIKYKGTLRVQCGLQVKDEDSREKGTLHS